ncbi:hypothetical protein NCAS_0C01780 [Naumovozyma castellii]|uniref:Transcription initiation factor IIA large subunit n=1 Tax=Naumovozyma castellii TaxID=27288 RepID=G0VCF8_NAUCA|nr:hypothetical protein NCAS_0C01780 [Naumovozyma castellii CBS 4309]CCC69168.1 hypothetical protein NCAS_0C01780 [Naumovozyma castellii CBS 4309]
MSNPEASKVYELIVDSVINEVREDFENAGIDEQTLQDLKRVWQTKLTETKVTNFTWDDELLPDLQQQQQPQPGQELTQKQMPELPLTVKAEDDGQNLLIPDLNNGQIQNNDTIRNGIQGIEGIPEPNTVNMEIKEETESHEQEQDTTTTTETSDELKLQAKQAKRSALLDNDEVGSELDDSDDDYLISEGEDDGPDENLMLCLYDKVTRTKARWKCSLKDGIVTINHKDYSFQKAQVEAEWV